MMMMMSSSDTDATNGSGDDVAAWYESYPSLARALRLLDKVENEQQELIGKRLYDFAKSLAYGHPAPKKEGEDASTAGLERLQKLMQNKQFHSQIGRGLNETLNLSDKGRNEVGQRLLLCLQALDNLKANRDDSNLNESQKRLQVYTLIQSVFEQDIRTFEAQGVAKKQEKVERQIAEENQRLLNEALSHMIEEGLSTEVLHRHVEENEPEEHVSFFSTCIRFWAEDPILCLQK